MLQTYALPTPDGICAKINDYYRAPEFDVVSQLIQAAELNSAQRSGIVKTAKNLVQFVREARKKAIGIDSFLNTYSLSTQEGIALMCLAEALLRVPDQLTIDKLIRDKLTNADWKSHVGESDSFFVNSTTWALVLTGKVLKKDKSEHEWLQSLKGFFNRSSEIVVRTAVAQAMKILSKQFVMGRTISEAIKRGRKSEEVGYRYSYDMLGEAALTDKDAERYFVAYKEVIETLGKSVDASKRVEQKSNISVKLSALHPRYQEAFAIRVREELGQKLLVLAQLAKQYEIALTVDAEESERLDLSLDIFADVYLDSSLEGWTGLGLAVQSYQKRAPYVIDFIVELAKQGGRRIMMRLIKGAYWDSEIKRSQMQGLKEYPVFTRKIFTDVSFQACAKKILENTNYIFPQFATHNAYSVAMVLEIAGDYRDYEFQCLHGMGKELYEQIVPADKYGIPCRVYAPVGSHEDLLPYLVRRLLENGANSSFVNRIVDESLPLDKLVEDPVEVARALLPMINTNIPLPIDIFMPERKNSKGIDWSDREAMTSLQHQLNQMADKQWEAGPMLANKTSAKHELHAVYSPQNTKHQVGQVSHAELMDVEEAFKAAQTGFASWSKTPVGERARILDVFADLLEEHTVEALVLASLEAGKTLSDGIAEVREAVDFCRYYAVEAKKLMGQPMSLKGYTGETNELSLHPRGTLVCISPWNFPLAIFAGQVVASLVTGNCVIAKPAEQTTLIAAFAVKLMHEAGFPKDVIQLLPGRGETIGAGLVDHPQVAGVIFTGSTQVAGLINQSLASRKGPIVPLIAETGGMNAMIVDSSALLEQVVNDVLVSAFGSAGQRCSALRICFMQKDVYPRFKHLLQGAMAELNIGLPEFLTTDVGPVIDDEALNILTAHVEKMKKQHEVIFECSLEDATNKGHFIAPIAFEIPSLSALEKEVFGPVLHVITYEASELEQVIEQINACGYGLTMGIQSRINETIEFIKEKAHVGNCYVNRNMIGAVVGLQPFGGEGLSGTGPKAGGPHYLPRLCHERTFTVDTTAAGGNASLMAISEL
jgi:RHH-type proline utilization regulon transcriptional repressor/proline dehydrogenase/delta 1-pyrroline-5-carboxylate dehydrogenase